jgi:hypothetical protein
VCSSRRPQRNGWEGGISSGDYRIQLEVLDQADRSINQSPARSAGARLLRAGAVSAAAVRTTSAGHTAVATVHNV